KTLMAAVKEKQFRSMSDLDPDKTGADSLKEEIELYNAVQAMDELDQIMARINGENQRLATDAENVAAAERIAQERTLRSIGPGGVPAFRDYQLIDPLPVRWNSKDDERLFSAMRSPSAFGRLVL